jgi:Protein ChrB, N-terminal
MGVTLVAVIWHLLIYRLPASPSRARVAAWRELRRLGALPLQQSVAAIPDAGDLPPRFDQIEDRIREDGGRTYRFRLTDLDDEQEQQLADDWNALRAQEYAEIVEECETKFEREVEFELFRENLTAAEAEELEADLDKIKRWFGSVAQRDVFGAPERASAEQAIARCEEALEAFVERVFHAEQEDGPSLEPPAPMSWGEGVPKTRAERERLAKQVTRLPVRSRRKRAAEGEGS